MLAYVLACICLLILGVSYLYFLFPFWVWSSCTKTPPMATLGQKEEETAATTGQQEEETAAITGQQEEETAPIDREMEDPEASIPDYEVFLSFRGPDSRQGIADVLYDYMTTAGIRVYRDNDELQIGDRIDEILTAIKNSKICVPIFSETFAASFWCLSEVQKMVELKKTIMPIFYTAAPNDVKLRTDLFNEDLKKHEERPGSEELVKKWKDALKAVGKIIGTEVKDTGLAVFSKSFVKALQKKLQVKWKHETDFLVSRDDQKEMVMELLDIDSADVRLVGLHGMGGIGKTTLVKVIFNQISQRFDCCSFMENVQETIRGNGPEYLQNKLLEDLDPKLRHLQRVDSVLLLRKNFCQKKVLIVLDNVTNRNQVGAIVKMSHSFGPGSRVIITTRDTNVLTREIRQVEMNEMNPDQALQLFSKHAFGEDSPPADFKHLSDQVLTHAGCLPLALQVIGSRLYQRDQKIWKATIEKLRKVPVRDVNQTLKMSIDLLEYEQKQIFLDIACFFITKDKSSAMYMWEACDYCPDNGVDVLVSMSLVEITKANTFRMHDLIQEFGRRLVSEECFIDPSQRSRVWMFKDAKEVLKLKQGNENVEGLFLEESYGANLMDKQFSSFRNLRLLKLVDTKLAGDFEDLLPKLKWFAWHQSPSEFTATNLSLENLVVLDLSQSFIDENWAGWSMIQMAKDLKVLDLTGCCNLTNTPDLSKNRSLERLILRGCRNLADIHSSVRELKNLKHLDVVGCSSLGALPEEFDSMENLDEILLE